MDIITATPTELANLTGLPMVAKDNTQCDGDDLFEILGLDPREIVVIDPEPVTYDGQY